MSKSYRPYHPEQDFLLPPSLREWLPENHLVYFVSDVVDNLNLSALDAVYGDEQRGQPPYDPRMMTKVLVYGYCVGVFSSRRIERRLAEDVGFRVLAAGNAPNFRTIADFRKLHLATLAGLFEEVLKIALEAGALKLGRVERTATHRPPGRQWLLFGEKPGVSGGYRPVGTRHRCLYRDRQAEASRIPPAVRARTVTSACDAGRAHEAQASDQGGAGRLCRTKNDCGAGLRPDQTGPRVSPVSLARLG